MFVTLFGFYEFEVTERREEEREKTEISSSEQAPWVKSTCVAYTMRALSWLSRPSVPEQGDISDT